MSEPRILTAERTNALRAMSHAERIEAIAEDGSLLTALLDSHELLRAENTALRTANMNLESAVHFCDNHHDPGTRDA